MEHNIESRTHNNVSRIYNYSAYEAFHNKTRKVFQKSQAVLVDALVRLLQDGNSVTLPRSVLCEYLNTTDKNLNRKLSNGGDLLEVISPFDSGSVARGSLQVNVCPAYGFHGTLADRNKAILDWYGERANKLQDLKDVYVKQSLLPYF